MVGLKFLKAGGLFYIYIILNNWVELDVKNDIYTNAPKLNGNLIEKLWKDYK